MDTSTYTSASPRILVVGSLNMDLVLRVARAPEAGETVMAHSLHHVPGGKGGNQAVACARLGGEVQLFGRLGADGHGQTLRAALKADGIDTMGVQTDEQTPTGLATILVDDAAQNRIIVAAGANGRYTLDADALGHALTQAAGLVMQLEVPMAEVLAAAQLARKAGCPVLLNPSPVQPLPDALWPLVDTLIVNEGEAAALAGGEVATPAEAAEAAQRLRAKGLARVVVTLGAAGAVAVDATGARHHPGRVVTAVDTTAAGDTFTGALAVALGQGESLDLAVQRGMRAGALCVMQPGAQPSIPTAAAVAASPMPPAWSPL